MGNESRVQQEKRGGRSRGARVGSPGRSESDARTPADSSGGRTAIGAASTARCGLAGALALPLSAPPQPTLRTEHDAPESRDAQWHDEPHIEQPCALQAWT